MRTALFASLAAAGVATVAAAQVNTRLEYRVSSDGLAWASSVSVLPGATVHVRAELSYVGAGTVYGLREVIFQPVVSGWLTGDLLLTTPDSPGGQGIGPVGSNRTNPPGVVPDAPGHYGRISPFGAVFTTSTSFIRGHAGTGAQQGMLRIARSHITNWIGVGATSGLQSVNNFNGRGGINVGQFHPLQLPTGQPPFSTVTLGAGVFSFAFNPAGDAARALSIGTPELGIGRLGDGEGGWAPDCTWWSSASGFSNADINRGSAEVIQATVNVIPGPASGVALGLGVFGVRRRTRSGVHASAVPPGVVHRS